MQAEFRRCLAELDVEGARRVWAYVAPHLPQLGDDRHALAMLHYARTQSESSPLIHRAYSHRWLSDNGLPSGLPDNLKPKAERIYPRIVEAVGVAVKAFSEASAPMARALERAMSNAVAECYADGVTDVETVRARMREAYNKVRA